MNNIAGRVGGIQKYSTSDGPGIRTTVFLKGCPLSCRWCHNPELIRPEKLILFTAQKCIGCGNCVKACPTGSLNYLGDHVSINEDTCRHCYACVEHCYSEALRLAGEDMTVEEVMRLVRQDKGYYDRTGGGMTISGGELLSQADFAESLLDAAAAEGIGVALDTCGCGNGDRLFRLAQKADYILYDMKSIDEETHKAATGLSNKIIIQNLERLADDPQVNPKIWMRMPLVQGVNDSEDIINRTCAFYEKHHLAYVTLFPYHELGISKYKSLGQPYENFAPPDSGRLHEIKALFEAHGTKTDILGEKIQ
ncbi:MAG: glycyl-radical enzyme activating protein [Clostridia bacterium]|nr:glycyl-radical enzyme activating protein [Clostridia bacterium]